MSRSMMLAAAAVLLLPGAALAHHGWSGYDADKTIQVSAPLSDLAWRNPHGTAKVAYQGKTWDVILAPVARMEARGLTPAMLAAGKSVTLVGYPRRDGTPEMRIERVTVGGQTVELR
ncbi:MAG: hypothetical protein JWP92_724 [Caulobacter sp.]|nr:hypothetical protein [Caulobacter sp.]